MLINRSLSFFGRCAVRREFLYRHTYATTTNLPLVDALVNKAKAERRANQKTLPLKDIGIIYVQHSFQTSLNVVDAFIKLGALPSNIMILDKPYSNCPGIAEGLSERHVRYQPGSPPQLLGGYQFSFIRDVELTIRRFQNRLSHVKKIIAVSHGRHFLELLPLKILQNYPIVGIEKTSSGLANPVIHGLPFPVIAMASSAAKLQLESPIIAAEVVKKLTPLIPIADKPLVCGVVGYGSIGKAITDKLIAMGHKVIVYDHDHSRLKGITSAKITKELVALIGFADYIFGCTGQDITAAIDIINFCNRDKTLISCSSGDEEFLSLLQLVQQKQNGQLSQRPFDDINYRNEGNAVIRILSGGFPVNFDRKSEASPPEDIQLTRALSVASVLHAAELFEQPELIQRGGVYKLSSRWQKFVATEFFKCQPSPSMRYSKELMTSFDNETWISDHSGGMDFPKQGVLLSHGIESSLPRNH